MSTYIFYQVYDEQAKLHAPVFGSCDPARYPFVGAFQRKDVGGAPQAVHACRLLSMMENASDSRCTELYATYDAFTKGQSFKENDVVNLNGNGYGSDPDHPLIFRMLSWDRK